MMKNKKYYLLSFIIPCILMILLYTTVGVIGGNKNILTVDLADQYVAFFNTLKNIFDGKIGIFYSFSKTLGGNLFGLICYYLMSPFNLLILFVDKLSIPNMILIINILKISFAGLTSYIYFSKTYKNDKTSLAFSIIYALMAYNIVYSQNIMWLDGVIMLPIIFLGIDKLIEKKPTLFYISLTLTIIFNYYIGYMICIGSLLYFIYKSYLKEQKINIKKIFDFIKYILLSVLTSSIILIPSIFSLLQGKANGFITEFIPNQKFAIFDIITRFFIGAFKNNDLSGGCPNLYVSLIVIVLVIHYFFNKNINEKEKKASLILLLVFILSFIFNPIDVIWHTFKHPYGFPFRYSFIFDFILLIIAYKNFINIDEIDKNFIKKFTLYSLLLTLIVDKLLYQSTMYYKVFMTFILINCYLLYLSKKKEKKINTGILLLITLEMFINSYLIVINIKYQNKNLYNNFVTNYGTIIEKINKEEDNFYRLEKDYSYSTNDELLLNYNGISHFSSVYEEKNNELLGKYLGIFNRFYITNSNGSTPVTNSLFNIKYYLSENEIKYYNKKETINNINVYENKYNLPLGFMVNEKLLDLELTKYEPFQNQNNILKYMNNSNNDIFKKEEYKITLNNLEIEEKEKSKKISKINKNKEGSIKFELKNKINGILYLYISPTKYKKIDVLVDGKSIININDQNNYYYNVLEIKNSNSKVEIILLEDYIEINDFMFYSLDLNKFENEIKRIKENDKLIITEYKTDCIKGNINVTKENQILYTSIPYDKGFKVYLNNKEIQTQKTLDSLLAIKLEQGNHEIIIKYELRGIKTGVILSILGIILYVIKRRGSKVE